VRTSGVTVVLSGGGAKAAAHIGAVRALVESGLTPVRYVATSMGAVIAAGLASGIAGNDLLTRLTEVGAKGIARDPSAVFRGLFARSLLRAAPLRRAIAALVPVIRFADLKVPLTVSVTNLDSGELLLYGAGGRDAPLLDVLVATTALPLYYPPVVLNGQRCGDGGLRGVLPLEIGAHLGNEPIVAVDVGPGFEAADTVEPPTMPALVRAHDEAVGTLMAAHTQEQLARWRAEAGRPPLTYVRPSIERYATFRVDRMREYSEQGYRATRDAIARSAAHT
jgi:predicted acylesterase/phospholipase RssA